MASELLQAAKLGDEASIRSLLDSQALAIHPPSQAADEDALYLACKNGHMGAVTALMDRGAHATTQLFLEANGVKIPTSPLLASLKHGEVFLYLVTRQPEAVKSIGVTRRMSSALPLAADRARAGPPDGSGMLFPRDSTTPAPPSDAEPLLHSLLEAVLSSVNDIDRTRGGVSLLLRALLLPGTGITGAELNSLGETAAQYIMRRFAQLTSALYVDKETSMTSNETERQAVKSTEALVACKDAGLSFSAAGKQSLNACHSLCAYVYPLSAGLFAVKKVLNDLESVLAPALQVKDERGAYPLDYLIARGAVPTVVSLFTSRGAPHTYGMIGRMSDGSDSSPPGVLALLRRKLRALVDSGWYELNEPGQQEWSEEEREEITALLHSPAGREAWYATDVFGQTALLMLAPAPSAEPLIHELMAAKAPRGRLNICPAVVAKELRIGLSLSGMERHPHLATVSAFLLTARGVAIVSSAHGNFSALVDESAAAEVFDTGADNADATHGDLISHAAARFLMGGGSLTRSEFAADCQLLFYDRNAEDEHEVEAADDGGVGRGGLYISLRLLRSLIAKGGCDVNARNGLGQTVAHVLLETMLHKALFWTRRMAPQEGMDPAEMLLEWNSSTLPPGGGLKLLLDAGADFGLTADATPGVERPNPGDVDSGKLSATCAAAELWNLLDYLSQWHAGTKTAQAQWYELAETMLEAQAQELLAASRLLTTNGDRISSSDTSGGDAGAAVTSHSADGLTSQEALRLFQLLDVFHATHDSGQDRDPLDWSHERCLAPFAPLLAHLARFHCNVFPPQRRLRKSLRTWCRALTAAAANANFASLRSLAECAEFQRFLREAGPALSADAASSGGVDTQVHRLFYSALATCFDAAAFQGAEDDGASLPPSASAARAAFASLLSAAATPEFSWDKTSEADGEKKGRVPTVLYRELQARCTTMAAYRWWRNEACNQYPLQRGRGVPSLINASVTLQPVAVRLTLLGELCPECGVHDSGVIHDDAARATWLRVTLLHMLQQCWLDPRLPGREPFDVTADVLTSGPAAVHPSARSSIDHRNTTVPLTSPARRIICDLIDAGGSPDIECPLLLLRGMNGPLIADAAFLTNERQWIHLAPSLRLGRMVSAVRLLKLLLQYGASPPLVVNYVEGAKGGQRAQIQPRLRPSLVPFSLTHAVASPFLLEVLQEAVWARRKHAVAARELIRDWED